MENKKIIGAKKVEFDGIGFNSRSEVSCYKKLKAAGLEFDYEPNKQVLWEGFKPAKTLIYAPKKIRPGKYGLDLLLQQRALQDMTWSIDFIITVEEKITKIHLEIKGMENDTYPIKKKMYIGHLEQLNDGYKHLFIEAHSARHVDQAIEIIKNL